MRQLKRIRVGHYRVNRAKNEMIPIFLAKGRSRLMGKLLSVSFKRIVDLLIQSALDFDEKAYIVSISY